MEPPLPEPAFSRWLLAALDIRIYCRKAEICHLSRVWIVESSMSARAAEVAALMRKLCPAYSSYGRPREERTACTCCTNHYFVTGDPCAVMKKGPSRFCRSSMYDTTAVTGQMGVSVRPTITSTPLPNWSHFDRFKWTFTIAGYVRPVVHCNVPPREVPSADILVWCLNQELSQPEEPEEGQTHYCPYQLSICA